MPSGRQIKSLSPPFSRFNPAEVDQFIQPLIYDNWQVHLIQRILQGYDSIFCAGTGYGKSLIFEALAVFGSAGKLLVHSRPLNVIRYVFRVIINIQ